MLRIKNISELLPDEPIPAPLDDEIIFNDTVREYTLLSVLVFCLVTFSHFLLLRYRRADQSHERVTGRRYGSMSLLPRHPDDEAIVDTIAQWVCTFSISVSMGAVLLLPISIVSNEVLATYKSSLYIRWLNRSLIQSLWNIVFLCSNLSLFVGLPFAYLFTEAEGFPGSKKGGLRARIQEAVVVLMLLVVLVLGVAVILSLLLGYYHHKSLLETIDVWWTFYLPFLYSLISCLGVLFLLICTPVGLARLFTTLRGLVKGDSHELPYLISSPDKGAKFLRNQLMEELNALTLEEKSLSRRLNNYYPGGFPGLYHQRSASSYQVQTNTVNRKLSFSLPFSVSAPVTPCTSPVSDSLPTFLHNNSKRLPLSRELRKSLPEGEKLRNEASDLYAKLQETVKRKTHLEKMNQQGLFRRCFLYPVGVLVLVLVTSLVVSLVFFNTLKLVSGFKALPSALVNKTEDLGDMIGKRAVLVWILGPLGALVEVLIIVYLVAASLVGCYSFPLMQKMKPVAGDTPMVHLIGNSVLLLMLASALPLLATTLGVTNFDLLGDYGSIGWLANFWIVLLYNVVFASAASYCLIQQFTAALRVEIYARLGVLWKAIIRKFRRSNSSGSNANSDHFIVTVAKNTLQRALFSSSSQRVHKNE